MQIFDFAEKIWIVKEGIMRSIFLFFLLSSTIWDYDLNFAVEFNDHSAAFWVAYDKGWFKEVGINIKNLKIFRTGLELAAAFARGDIDVGIACLGPCIVLYKRGVPIKVLMMLHLHGYALVSGEGVKNIKELDGEILTTSGKGAPVWLLAKIIEDKFKLKFKLKKMPPFVAASLIASEQIKGGFLPEHYVSLVVNKGGVIIINSQDVWGNMPGSVLIVKKSLLEDEEIIEKLKNVFKKALQYINSNFEDASRIVARHLKLKDWRVVYESMKNLVYTDRIDRGEIEKYINLMIKWKAIEGSVDIEDFIVWDEK